MSDKTQTDGPLTDGEMESSLPSEAQYDRNKAREGVRLLLEAIGEDPNRPGLQETWQRRVPAAFETLTEGNRGVEKPELTTFETESDELVIKTGIPVHTLCEHHLLPFHGTAAIAYRPDEEVVGLSKISRYVRWQSRQLTMQEELTQDIAEGLADEVGAETVLVQISATHLCEAMRGIETATTTTTQATVGEPTTAVRTQFRNAISKSN
jgi:GTP cyclohydrolase I